MSDYFMGEVRMLASSQNLPRNWARCDGALVPVAQNAALFQLLGTRYGGDGKTSFALPDMRGRAPKGVPSDKTGSLFEPGTAQVAVAPVAGSGYQLSSPPVLAVSFIISTQGFWPSRQ